MIKSKRQTFNAGVCNIYTVKNVAEPGNMPKDGLALKIGPLRYSERVVGSKRYWSAAQAQARIDLVLRVPQCREISPQDVCVLRDGQYRIKQVQHITDDVPVTDISLERMERSYDLAPIS